MFLLEVLRAEHWVAVEGEVAEEDEAGCRQVEQVIAARIGQGGTLLLPEHRSSCAREGM